MGYKKITQRELNEILELHKMWLDRKDGKRADLTGVDLCGLNLHDVNLEYADLHGANLSKANLSCANLSYADLHDANLSETNLKYAELFKANLSHTYLILANLLEADLMYANLENAILFKAALSDVDLSYTNLIKADLSYAYLYNANLKYANLTMARLEGTDLRYARLTGANLTDVRLELTILAKVDLNDTKGLINPIEYLNNNFEKTTEGYIVYKIFDEYKNKWEIKPNSIIETEVNYNRCDKYGCGINITTKKEAKKLQKNIKKEMNKKYEIWKLLIKWEWLPTIVIPYNTDGRIRCGKAMLIEVINE